MEMACSDTSSVAGAEAVVKCLGAVPPAALPAIVDCVLASSGLSPYALFSSLIEAFPSFKKDLLEEENGKFHIEDSGRFISFTSALIRLLKKLGNSHDAFQSFIWKVCFPLLNILNTNNYELINKISEILCEVVVETNAWQNVEVTIVPFCLNSLVLSIGKLQIEERELQQGRFSSLEGQDDMLSSQGFHQGDALLEYGSCPLSIACHVLSSLLLSAINVSREDQTSEKPKDQHPMDAVPMKFAKQVVEDLSDLVVCMLSQRSDDLLRSCAIRVLLPSIFETYDVLPCFGGSLLVKAFVLSRACFSRAVWNCCRCLFLLGPQERQDAYLLLSLCLRSFFPIKGCDNLLIGNDAEEFDVRLEKEFWEELRRGLVDKDALMRKRALHILKLSLDNFSGPSARDGNFSGSEMYVGSKIEHKMPVEKATPCSMTKRGKWAEEEAKSLGVGRMSNSDNHCLSGRQRWDAFILLYEMLEEYGTHLVEAAWTHQVELSPPRKNSRVTKSGRCQKRLKGDYFSETSTGAMKFFSQFCNSSSVQERISLVRTLSSVTKRASFGRAGFMTLAACISSIACTAYQHNEGVSQSYLWSCSVDPDQANSIPQSSAGLLENMQFFLEQSKQHFNQNYRRQVFDYILAAVSTLVSVHDVPLDTLLHFISVFPRAFTDAGYLRRNVQCWLSLSCDACLERLPFQVESCVLHNLYDFPKSFIRNNSHAQSATYDDDDLNSWCSEAQRWARLLFLVLSEEDQLKPVLSFVEQFGSKLFQKALDKEWIPVKFLVLILSIVQEWQVGQTKSSRYFTEFETVTPQMMEISNELSIRLDVICGTFLSIMGELVSFAHVTCDIFWSFDTVKDAPLPSSVTGKLGGPSQRRLAASTSTAVLNAIYSLRTVSSMISCFAYSKEIRPPDSSITFLWNFLWKVLALTAPSSETGGEIRLAAYEALVFALKALPNAFSPLAVDRLVDANNTLCREVDQKHLLDPLFHAFLRNIDDLLGVGMLARSRRAVLMQWKWCCLDSLLTAPYHMLEKDIHLEGTFPFISPMMLKRVFLDVVDSLEHSGESSVLPILRSIRLILSISFTKKKMLSDSSSIGIDIEMMWKLVRSAWTLYVNCNKRRVAPIAALLSSVLHSSLFNDLGMHQTAGTMQGPLKWFVERILEEGGKSPRTVRLAALHLTGLWLMYPETIKYYMAELKLLTLYGSVAFDEDFEAEILENGEGRREFLSLAQRPDLEFTEEFLNTEMYPRVAVAVLFQKLASLREVSRLVKQNEDACAAFLHGRMFLLELLDSAVNDKYLSKELYKKHSMIHRHKVRAWQMICVLSLFVDESIVEEVTSMLHVCLYRNNLPAVRQFLEIFAIQLYLKFPSKIREQFVPIFQDHNMRPQALSSYVFIAANVILHTTEVSVQLKHLDELLPPIIPLLTSHHHNLRGFTQILVYQVLCKLMPSSVPTNSEAISMEKKCFLCLRSYLQENSDCMRLRSSMEKLLDAYDPIALATPAGLFSSKHEDVAFECAPTSIFEKVINFLNDVREDLRDTMAKNAMIVKNDGLAVAETMKSKDPSFEADNEKLSPQIINDTSFDFQKKITLQKHVTGGNEAYRSDSLHKSLAEMEKEDELLSSMAHSRNSIFEGIRGCRQHFILVASLLDRIPNLAGLARTCEVFKAAGFVVADASIVHDKQFQLISVTAEKWVPIIEVPEYSLKSFLMKKKREGFSLLGLEQTANSIPLDQYSFPKKSVLVLGREKEGIPVDIIHVLDACLEIPQLGVVRSLNVHVSGAIALWEYTRQHRSR
ncbi:uncharacterized protein LOC18429133 [Amborella trichopoda]|uniref:uncharacterized protein LOC18429133 n=1 Tax=Amborella trichopoda TaxID=13333 RepID=UPI0009BD3658|nr:uncharacterized protein LOC18429133 [Amborella trichopoda]|eukprot:XP_020520025.1 uncharacterized protein LOC18429133 [Amborella trichopoda]